MEGRQPAGMDDETAALFPDSFEDSPLGEIPKGWRSGTFGEVAKHPRRTIKPENIEPSRAYIGLDHMPRKSIALGEWDSAEGLGSNKYEFRLGDILFGKLRPYFHKVGVAPLNGVCSTDILVVAPDEPEWFGFVLGHISSTEFVGYTNASSTGTRMPRTNWKDMSSFELVIPSVEVARLFTDLVRPFTDRIIANIHQSNNLAAIRDTLLPKLLSGEVRVGEAEEIVEDIV
jgi:type I restriction enzyme S subunit